MVLPILDNGVLESVSEVLGDTARGFTGSEIGRYLKECNIPDILPSHTKRIRLFEALKAKQLSDNCGNNIAAFIQYSMNPVRHHSQQDWFVETQSKLNHILAFAGYKLEDNGKLILIQRVETHSQAIARASKLREYLIARRVHNDVLRY